MSVYAVWELAELRAANPPPPAALYTLYPVTAALEEPGGLHERLTWCGLAVPLSPMVTVEFVEELLDTVN